MWDDRDDPSAEQRRKGLRVAFAVSLGFTSAVSLGAIVPFLVPIFAAQFLLGSSGPMPLGKTLGAALLILFTGIGMMVLTNLFGDRPSTFLILLALIYFFCFAAQAAGTGGPAIFLVQVVAIMVPLIGILNKDLANSILSILVTGILGGTLLMWLAHAVIPEPHTTRIAAASSATVRPPSYLRALANTAILLGAVAVCLVNDQLSAALVIPITVASLLGQFDAAASSRMALGLVIINLSGGILASIAYTILTLRPSLFSIFLIVLVVTLILGGRAAGRLKDAKMYAGALTTFLILFGLGVSPVPGGAAESFATRIVYVGAALIYTVLMAAIFWPQSATRESRAK
ncbi:DUF2955 domain-containing protein [Rhizobium sp. SEMIA 4085]|uniref:DUF2955 domain-containing protein n=1 Tax=Rhizobium sp. SEMIA 4085 TaxID=2137761 RepID=UPI001478510F|nr:DUF2955 domain-containing protein [Rhizobium sp. SEMIA 4085]NNH32776.1 DUF2955 domain-containing protein [Rhizobium sp. SEMIA 4085]